MAYTGEFRIDPKGYFLIKITDGKIHVGLFDNKTKKLISEYKGTKPQDIFKEIIKDNNITYPEHAAYLGEELKKVEYAIKYSKKYIQDDEIF